MEMSAYVQVAKMCHLAMLSLNDQVRVMAHPPAPSIVTH
jgi:hypothetical protein